MKKKLLNILIAFIFIITSCGPHNDNDGLVSIGETITIKNDEGDDLAEITYNSCDDEEVEDKDKVMIIENVTIKPLKEFKIGIEDIYLRPIFLMFHVIVTYII